MGRYNNLEKKKQIQNLKVTLGSDDNKEIRRKLVQILSVFTNNFVFQSLFSPSLWPTRRERKVSTNRQSLRTHW